MSLQGLITTLYQECHVLTKSASAIICYNKLWIIENVMFLQHIEYIRAKY